MWTTLACLFIAAVVALGQALPSPETITIVQEREARERSIAGRIAYQAAKQPKPAPTAEAPAGHLSPTERQELIEALDRYFRENGGRTPLFWSPPRERQ